jgi:CRP/FNR family transcriptional regulator, cyclic AMP receptor protein
MSLLDADPDFGELLEAGELARARLEGVMRVDDLAPGEWDAGSAQGLDDQPQGYLVVDGLLARTVDVLGRRCAELIGPGDVIRPWQWDDGGSHVQAEIGWLVLEPTRLARIDGGLVTRIAPWPELGLELFTRGIRRAHNLGVTLAIAYHQRVDERLLLTLWHLAERYGRVHPDGIVVALPLAHRRLAALVGAHRPSVTTAIGELTRRGALSRREHGEWVLHGDPPEQLRQDRLTRPTAREAR